VDVCERTDGRHRGCQGGRRLVEEGAHPGRQLSGAGLEEPQADRQPQLLLCHHISVRHQAEHSTGLPHLMQATREAQAVDSSAPPATAQLEELCAHLLRASRPSSFVSCSLTATLSPLVVAAAAAPAAAVHVQPAAGPRLDGADAEAASAADQGAALSLAATPVGAALALALALAGWLRPVCWQKNVHVASSYTGRLSAWGRRKQKPRSGSEGRPLLDRTTRCCSTTAMHTGYPRSSALARGSVPATERSGHASAAGGTRIVMRGPYLLQRRIWQQAGPAATRFAATYPTDDHTRLLGAGALVQPPALVWQPAQYKRETANLPRLTATVAAARCSAAAHAGCHK
jgi:hypothetical protein